MYLRNLDRTRKELLMLISDCSDEVINKRIHPEKWTIAQVLEHLYLVERGMALAIRQGLKSEDHPTPIKPLDSLLDRSTKINAPTNVIPNPEYQTKASVLSMLTKSRSSLLSVIERIEEPSYLIQKSITHPIIGQMNLRQAIEFIALHEQRHMEQIKEILSN